MPKDFNEKGLRKFTDKQEVQFETEFSLLQSNDLDFDIFGKPVTDPEDVNQQLTENLDGTKIEDVPEFDPDNPVQRTKAKETVQPEIPVYPEAYTFMGFIALGSLFRKVFRRKK